MQRTDRADCRSATGRPRVVGIVLALLVGAATAHGALAQRTPGTVTLGVQVGQPGGATVKLYRDGTATYDALLTTDGTDFTSLYVHRLWERPLPNSSVHLYAGPGILVGAQRLQTRPRILGGISSEAGLNFFVERFEVFLHVTPVLRILPAWQVRFGGSVGLRYRL